MKKWILRTLAALGALLFAWAAALQYNDPDPLAWLVIYGAAAASCALFAAGRTPPFPVVASVLVVATVWALWLATVVLGNAHLTAMFPDAEQSGSVLVDAEEGREMGGLAIVAIAMLPLTVFSYRQRRKDPPHD